MLTKTNIARKVADEGITVIIANGKRDNILVDLLQHPEETLCTRFIPSDEPVSSVKKWIAHSEGFAKGEIHINECATEVLNSEKAVSILPSESLILKVNLRKMTLYISWTFKETRLALEK